MAENGEGEKHRTWLWSPAQVKEYVEAILGEKEQATEMAEREREKAAQALEREKRDAARALATAMQMQMSQGDENLKSHIDQQIGQIREALVSAQRESDIRFQASEKAIEKADKATEKRLESVNEFRENLADQSASFIPREVHESEISALRKDINEAKSLAQSAKDKALGASEVKDGMSTSYALAIGGMGLFISALVVILNLLT